MDRETAIRYLTSFTVSTNLKRPGGVGMAGMVEADIAKTLKVLMDEGKAFKRESINRETGMRDATYYFQSGKGINRSVQALMNTLPGKYGYDEDPSKAPFAISGQKRARFSEINERFLDPRTQAAVQAGVLRAGGTSSVNKQTGFTRYMVPYKDASRFTSMADIGDERYLSGASAAAFGHSTGATPEERAYGMVARQDRMSTAKAAAEKEYIKKNPNSELAKKARAERMEENMGTARLAGGALMGVIGTIAGLVAASVGVLGKILGGVMETARATTKLMVDSAKYNVTNTDMKQFQAISKGMGFKDGEDPFSSIMGSLVEKFANPASAGFGGAVGDAAKFLQRDTTDVLGFITSNVSNPKQMMYKLLADAMNITMSGRGGVQSGMSIDKALMTNIPEVAKLVGNSGADVFARLPQVMGAKFRAGGAISAEELQNLLETSFGVKLGQGSANAVVAPTLSVEAAKQGTKSVNEIGQILSGAGDTIFTKILGYLGQILEVLRKSLRPYIAAMDPGWEARENAAAVAENSRLSLAAESDMKRYKPGSIEYEAAKTRLERLKAGRNVDIGGIGVDTLHGRTVMPMGMSDAENAQMVSDMYYKKWYDAARANQDRIDSPFSGKVPVTDDFVQSQTINSGIGSMFSAAMATYGTKGRGKSAGALALINALKGKDSTLPLHSFTEELRDAGYTSEDVSQLTKYLKDLPAAKGKGTIGDAYRLLISDMELMQETLAAQDIGSNSFIEKAADAQKRGVRVGEDYLLAGRAYAALVEKVGASGAASIYDKLGTGGASEYLRSMNDNRAVIDVNFINDKGEKKTITLDVASGGIAVQGPRSISTSGADVKVVAGAARETS